MTYYSAITKNPVIKKDKFLESLRRTLNLIETGMKDGVDNLESILDSTERIDLGDEMIDILNRSEIEYKQGNKRKIDSLRKMTRDYYNGNEHGIRRLIDKHAELVDLVHWNTSAKSWLNDLDQDFGYKTREPLTDKLPDVVYANDFTQCDPAELYSPPSITQARTFFSNKYINKLHTDLERNIEVPKNGGISCRCTDERLKGDLLKLKEISADKYAYTRAELLNMLELYNDNEYQA